MVIQNIKGALFEEIGKARRSYGKKTEKQKQFTRQLPFPVNGKKG